MGKKGEEEERVRKITASSYYRRLLSSDNDKACPGFAKYGGVKI